jgi:hypothetical protein
MSLCRDWVAASWDLAVEFSADERAATIFAATRPEPISNFIPTCFTLSASFACAPTTPAHFENRILIGSNSIHSHRRLTRAAATSHAARGGQFKISTPLRVCGGEPEGLGGGKTVIPFRSATFGDQPWICWTPEGLVPDPFVVGASGKVQCFFRLRGDALTASHNRYVGLLIP